VFWTRLVWCSTVSMPSIRRQPILKDDSAQSVLWLKFAVLSSCLTKSLLSSALTEKNKHTWPSNPRVQRVFLFTLYLHVIVHLRMESDFGMDRRREDPLQGQAQLRASRCCIATLGRSFLLLLTRNCNSSPICSVHIVLSYVQFVDSSWF